MIREESGTVCAEARAERMARAARTATAVGGRLRQAPPADPPPASGMDAVQIVRVLRRRWRLTTALITVLLALCAATVFLVPVQHRVTGVLLVLTQPGPEGGNPYAQVDRAQAQAAGLVVTVLDAPRTRAELAAAGAVGDIEVSNEDGQLAEDSPFLTVTVTAAEPDAALRTSAIVIDRAREELTRRQDASGVAPGDRVVLSEVLPADLATTTRASQLRAVVLVFGLGLAAVIGGVLVYDRVRAARSADGSASPPRGQYSR
ncbi:hypothetical protein FHR81_003577 [Actinoalloteichus hoggarensis]|uniref:Uncharacterized protein n=1 Tax=Actinoalloteichus hoggarensis TaxID=1470176 RepID=A0A221WBG5_9PSEU|nr:hypothetical protein [Actinoalloteichus hoggarensis]ASO22916.1 hypothetical protein AHOG_26570 [Actinoalloteichus hoggarensis]MBB5922520.1 hypothetical protein [Actinoalloteichus hoggarensis]